MFAVKDHGDFRYCLGIEAHRDSFNLFQSKKRSHYWLVVQITVATTGYAIPSGLVVLWSAKDIVHVF